MYVVSQPCSCCMGVSCRVPARLWKMCGGARGGSSSTAPRVTGAIYILVLHRRARTAACAAAVGVRGRPPGPRLRFRGSGRPGAASWAGRTGSSGWKEVGEKDRALSAGPRRRAEGTRLTAGSPCGQPETTAGALRRVRQRAGDG